MQNFELKKVATAGCEIRNEDGEVIGWSVDAVWGTIIVEAVEQYLNKEAA